MIIMILSGCSQENLSYQNSQHLSSPNYYDDMALEIMVNVMTRHFGGYNKSKLATRAGDAFTITPYIEGGDTLMYIVQYNEGWELYSASKATNMLIFSSEEGVFDINDHTRSKAMKSIISSSLEKIKMSKRSDAMYADRSWGAMAITDKDLKAGSIYVKNKNGTKRAVGSEEIPPGDWILIETEVLSKESYTSPKLIKTKWHQTPPWNQYCKLVKNNSGNMVPALAGCSPIAISQYLYLTHFKDGIPKYCRANASLASDGVTYEFNGHSSSIWNEMSTGFYLPENNLKSAILIGWVGKELKASYGLSLTSVYIPNEQAFLYDVYGVHFSMAPVDISYIMLSLDKGYPLLAIASQTESGYNDTHRFLIDSYSTENTVTKYTYGLKRYPTPDEKEDKWKSDDVDENGMIISYAYTNEVIRTTTTNKISMNWGDNTSDDYSYYYPYNNWDEESVNANYKYNQYILKRADIK